MKLKNVLKWIALNPMEILSAASLTACILMAVMNAFTRYALSWTWNPTTDLTTLLFGWLVFCGSAAAYKRKMHYGIDIVVSKLPEKARNAAKMLAHVLTAVSLVTATVISWQLSVKATGKLMPNTNIPYFWYDLSAVVGFFYMAVYEIEQTVQDIKILYLNKNAKEGEKA